MNNIETLYAYPTLAPTVTPGSPTITVAPSAKPTVAPCACSHHVVGLPCLGSAASSQPRN